MCTMCLNDELLYGTEYHGLCIFIDWSPDEWNIGPNSETYVPGVGAARFAVQECEDVGVGEDSVYVSTFYAGDRTSWPVPEDATNLDHFNMPRWLREIVEKDEQRAALDEAKDVLAPEASLVGAAGR